MESKCWVCGEPTRWHQILGYFIEVGAWHRVWSGKGVELKPSDAWLKKPRVSIPRQRTSPPMFKSVHRAP